MTGKHFVCVGLCLAQRESLSEKKIEEVRILPSLKATVVYSFRNCVELSMATKKVSERYKMFFKFKFLEFRYYSDNFMVSNTKLRVLGR